MNNKLSALVFLASASIAFALDPSAPVVREVGGVAVQTAERIPAVFGSTYPYDNAGDEAWARDGWRNRTPQELADEAEAAALAASVSAQYADPQPAVFVPRVGATITEIVGQSQIFVDSATSELFAVDETGSPEHTLAQKQKQADARKAKVAAAKTAKGKGKGLNALADRVAALEALNGIE